ncbi:hypothetical protein JW916_10005 [Candidatus Sumerlaeota bacterium]|nr:hypothetical protein [Candidatus Sumerlaeota bacterium]
MSKKVLFLLAVFAAAVAAMPNLYGLMKAPPTALYLWSSRPWDTNCYFFLMRLGFEGGWLYTNLLTTEPHPSVFSLPFYIALGHVAKWYSALRERLTGTPLPSWRAIPLVFQHARTVLTFLLVLAIYAVTAQLTERRHRRLWIVVYSVFAGGATGLTEEITGFTEGSVLASCVAYPHFIAALILYMAVCGAMLIALRIDESSATAPSPKRRTWAFVLAFVGGLGLASVHAFDLPPLFAIGAVVILVRWLQTRRLPRTFLIVYVVFCAPAGLYVLHQMSLLWRWPVFRQMESNHVLKWWGPWASLRVMDGLLLLSLPGLVFLLKRRRRPEAVFLVVWVLTVVAAIHAPINCQRRLIEGLPIAFACVLPWTVDALLVRTALRWRGRWSLSLRTRIRLVRHTAYTFVLVLLLPRTFAMLDERSVGRFGVPNDLYYADLREVEAGEWLSRHAPPGSVVWASIVRGNRLPFLSGLRVFYGHHLMTVDPRSKVSLTKRLFSFTLPVSQFRATAKAYGIDYVFWTEADRANARFKDREMATYDPETLGEPVFDNGFAKIFAVRKD